MARHEPLTQSQRDLLAEIEAEPIVMTVGEQQGNQRGEDLSYLMRCDYLNTEAVLIAQETANNSYRYSRSTKPLQED